MSIWNGCFLFLVNPRGGVEDFDYLAGSNPWVKGVFCNVRDYDVTAWNTVRSRALAKGLVCGPWGRTAQGPDDSQWSEAVLRHLVAVADVWHSPLVVNCEKEIDGSGSSITTLIRDVVGDRDAALSVQAWPFNSVDWRPVGRYPILPQIFPAESEPAKRPADCKAGWHTAGAQLVYFTFGTYSTHKPTDFDLKAAYSLYPGDHLMATRTLEVWKPTSMGFDPTSGLSVPPLTKAKLAPEYREKIIDLVREWEALPPTSSPTPLARLTLCRRIMHTTDAQWNAIRPEFRALLDGLGVEE